MFQYQIKMELKEIIRQIDSIQERMRELPEGELLCIQNGNYTKWMQSNGAAPVYIPKENRQYAELLAIKKYYRLQLKELLEEKEILEACLRKYEKHKVASERLLDDSSRFKELLQSHFQSNLSITKEWIETEYIRNMNHPEHLIHKTLAGHFVRSKSEVIIANALFTNKIPYRYECELRLGDITISPDFTILHPIHHKVFYWEHFGMMNIPTYRDNTFIKLKTYGEHNIIPSINLITTYETQTYPINSKKVNHIINEYFSS